MSKRNKYTQEHIEKCGRVEECFPGKRRDNKRFLSVVAVDIFFFIIKKKSVLKTGIHQTEKTVNPIPYPLILIFQILNLNINQILYFFFLHALASDFAPHWLKDGCDLKRRGVGEVLLLRIDGGLHAGLHCAGAREVPRPLDMRALRRGRERRVVQIAERYEHR